MLRQADVYPANGKVWGHDAMMELEEFVMNSKALPKKPGNKGRSKKKSIKYLDIVSAFDIETTSLPDIKHAFMYMWQWSFYNLSSCEWVTVFGRTWEEWRECMETVIGVIPDGHAIVVLDHNLSFEFQFLREYIDFSIDDVFATESRAVVKCRAYGKLEYRCTMRHSNTGLSVYTKQWNVEHVKLSGDDFGYDKIRYPWTELSHDEILYGLHDVIGLIEAYCAEMKYWKDDLYTVPLTSTGYVRRICKNAWSTLNYLERRAWMPKMEIIDLLEEAFRGGDTHANRLYATPDHCEAIITHVQSWDRASSYPDVLINCMYPLGDWYRLQSKKQDWIKREIVEKYVYEYNKAVLSRVHMRNVRLKNRYWAVPYIPKAKLGYYENIVTDNGRIISADVLSMTITDVDWRIISAEYDFDAVYFSDTYYCRYRYLPDAFRDVVREFFRRKTLLKGSPEGSLEEIEYHLQKQLLNALYGMAAQHVIKESVYYIADTGDYMNEIDYNIALRTKEFEDAYKESGKEISANDRKKFHKEMEKYRKERRQELLDKTNKSAFLPYSIGVWCTAWARYELHRILWEVDKQGGENIYVDTDSNKFSGNVDLTELNKSYMERALKNNAYADDKNGIRHYMGVYEYEYSGEFATMGAKKYVVKKDGEDKLRITIAGVNKQKGAKELEKNGGFAAFRTGMKFVDAGGVKGIYNDKGYGEITVDGHTLYIGSNVCLLPDTYTLSSCDDYSGDDYRRTVESWVLRHKIDGYTLGGSDE